MKAILVVSFLAVFSLSFVSVGSGTSTVHDLSTVALDGEGSPN